LPGSPVYLNKWTIYLLYANHKNSAIDKKFIYMDNLIKQKSLEAVFESALCPLLRISLCDITEPVRFRFDFKSVSPELFSAGFEKKQVRAIFNYNFRIDRQQSRPVQRRIAKLIFSMEGG